MSGNRAVREHTPETTEVDPVETVQHRAIITTLDDKVVWKAQPPHYQTSAAAAQAYGIAVASKVYGISWHRVRTESRAVGPWKDDA